MYELGSHWTDFHEILYWRLFYENLLRKSKFSYRRTKMLGVLWLKTEVTVTGDNRNIVIGHCRVFDDGV